MREEPTNTRLNPLVDTEAVDASVVAPSDDQMAEMFADGDFLELLRSAGMSEQDIDATIAELGWKPENDE